MLATADAVVAPFFPTRWSRDCLRDHADCIKAKFNHQANLRQDSLNVRKDGETTIQVSKMAYQPPRKKDELCVGGGPEAKR